MIKKERKMKLVKIEINTQIMFCKCSVTDKNRRLALLVRLDFFFLLIQLTFLNVLGT